MEGFSSGRAKDSGAGVTMSDVLVKVEGVSKKFCKNLKRTMLYGIQDITKNMLGVEPDTGRLRPGEFWSVDDISFEVRRGECLGLIGPNGAGKSTILKILNGIMAPDKGSVEIRGRVGALIEVTAGFHPMLTGRENIYINGAILGFSKKEIDKKFDEIYEFSELGEFIDTPVKHYSSGMNVRLGFAIAAQMRPDVLLIDEILAVGDVGFRTKCINAIGNIMKDSAVIFVSHSIPDVAKIGTKVCVIQKGEIVFLGNDVPGGIERYYYCFPQEKGHISGNGKAKIHKIELKSHKNEKLDKIQYMDDLYVHLYTTVDPEITNPAISIVFKNRESQLVAQCLSTFNDIRIVNTGGLLHTTVKLKEINFNPGVYFLTVIVWDERRSEILEQWYDILELKVFGRFIGYAPIQLIGEWSVEKEEVKL